MVTQTQACSIDDSSPSLKHNENNRKTTSSKLYLPTAPNAGWSWLLKRGKGREGREGGGGERDEGERERD